MTKLWPLLTFTLMTLVRVRPNKIIHLNSNSGCHAMTSREYPPSACPQPSSYSHEVHTACARGGSDPDEAEVGCGQMTHVRGHHAAHELVTELVVRHDPWEGDRKGSCCKETETQCFPIMEITVSSGHFSFLLRVVILFGFYTNYVTFAFYG